MLSFKQFIQMLKEEMKTYRSGFSGQIGQYDDEYFDLSHEKLKDDTGKAIAWKHRLIRKKPRQEISELIPKDENILHRGVSYQEYQNIMKRGKIESHGKGNLGDEQKGTTSFTTNPETAEYYSKSFTLPGKEPHPDRPPYIISVRKPSEDRIRKVEGTNSDERSISGPIDKADIVAVHRGKVVDYNPPIKNRGYKQKAMSQLRWERIDKGEDSK